MLSVFGGEISRGRSGNDIESRGYELNDES